MIIVNVRMNIKEDKREEYLKLMDYVVDASNQKNGVHFYSHFENALQRNQFIIIENYINQEAMDSHNQSEHYHQLMDNIESFLYFNKCIIIV